MGNQDVTRQTRKVIHEQRRYGRAPEKDYEDKKYTVDRKGHVETQQGKGTLKQRKGIEIIKINKNRHTESYKAECRERVEENVEGWKDRPCIRREGWRREAGL